MKFEYTRHQTPRSARPDAEVAEKMYLIKNVSELRLTYQIRMLAYIAETRGKTLIIDLPKGAKVHESLRDFVAETGRRVKSKRG
jgi:hypothetical protein